MKALELPIFFENESTNELSKLGIDINLDDSDLRMCTFYNIDLITPYLDEGISYTHVHSCGMEFICNLNYKQVKQLIEG